MFRARAVDIQCITEHCALKCKLSFAAYAYMQYVFRLLQCVLLVVALPQGFVCSIFERLRFGRIGTLKKQYPQFLRIGEMPNALKARVRAAQISVMAA